MIYFCADDYGVSESSNRHIEKCFENGVLNKVSVLPNGEITDFKNRLTALNASISLHINLVEGKPLSNPKDIDLIISDNGFFKHSFIGLFFLSLSGKRREFEKQIYKEIKNQVKFWKTAMGENNVISIDSHQHTHMIPLVFKTLMRVICEEGLSVENIRIPAEPVQPYILTPSLFLSYTPAGLIKQWLLKSLAFINRNEIKKHKIQASYFMGVMFSGRLNEEKIQKILPWYLKLAEKTKRNIEIGFHPGYIKSEDELIDGIRESFKKYYLSSWRKAEYNTLLNLKF